MSNYSGDAVGPTGWGPEYIPQQPAATPSPPVQQPTGPAGGPAPHGGTSPQDTVPTVHLCAGTYLDDDFCRRALNEVYYEPRRAIAPYMGADTAAILGHAKRSRNLLAAEQAILLSVLLLFLCISIIDTYVAISILVMWHFQIMVVRLISDAIAYVKSGGTSIQQRLVGRTILTFVVLVTVLPVVFLLVPLILGVFTHSMQRRSDFATATSFMTMDPDITMVFLGLVAVTVGIFAGVRGYQISLLRYGTGTTGADPAPRIDFIRRAQYTKVVCYSGDSPFIGSGEELRTWQFAMPLKPNRHGNGISDGSPWPHFNTNTLTDHIRASLATLAYDSAISRRLPEFQLTDQAFVAGLATRIPTQWPHELAASGLPHTMDAIKADPTSEVRHYLRCQIRSWQGELVTTVYVHAALQGETLYMEFSSFVLPPTDERFHVLGDSPSLGALTTLGVFRALVQLPSRLGRSPIVLTRILVDAIKGASRTEVSSSGLGTSDHGARVSLRELGTDPEITQYFQKRDAVKYTRILERQLLRTTIDYLDARVDTSELTNRAETIINHGVVNTGTVNVAAQGAGAIGNVGAIGPDAHGNVNIKGS